MGLRVKSSVNIFIINNGKVLLSRRKNTGWLDGQLCVPGGHVEVGETPTQAIKREVEEELGVTVDVADLEFLCVAQRQAQPEEHVAFEFVIKDKKYAYTNAEPNKCSELVWADPRNLPKDVITDFRIIIEQAIINGKKYIEVGYL
jgi:8-oxo-dGTP diphosphatase